MYRYVTTLEEFGFATFMTFASYYQFYINDYQQARMLLEQTEGNLLNDDLLYGLYTYAKFLVYGHLERMSIAFEGYGIASHIFHNKINIRRLAELLVYSNVYKLLDRLKPETFFDKIQLDYLTNAEKNKYLFYLALQSDAPEVYTRLMEQKDQYYLGSLFFQALRASSKEDKEAIDDLKREINSLHYETAAPIDYIKLLKLIETKDDIGLKEYLINFVLPFVKKRQNIFLMRLVVRKISQILQDKKRYKDALTYVQKIEHQIDEFKYKTEVEY